MALKRNAIVILVLVLALALGTIAMAQGPPEGDPSKGKGSNGNAGCEGINEAEDRREDRGNSNDAIDMVKRILACNGNG